MTAHWAQMATKRSYRAVLGPLFSEGARLCWVRIAARGWSREDLTRQIGCSRGAPSRWLYGDRKPDRESAVKIRRVLGIPESAWDDAPTEPFLPPALRVLESSPPPKAA